MTMRPTAGTPLVHRMQVRKICICMSRKIIPRSQARHAKLAGAGGGPRSELASNQHYYSEAQEPEEPVAIIIVVCVGYDSRWGIRKGMRSLVGFLELKNHARPRLPPHKVRAQLTQPDAADAWSRVVVWSLLGIIVNYVYDGNCYEDQRNG